MCSMAQEDHTLRCNNSSRLSKKFKKVPQRGMGVAQLEKLILEEQQKKDVADMTPNSTNFRSPVIPLPSPLPPNNRPLISRSEAISGVFVTKAMNSGSGGGNNFSRLWTCVENPNPNQNRALDHRGYAVTMPTNLGGLPYESNKLVWPPVPRSHFQQPSTSSMANVSLGTTSASSSSVMNFQTEPPSNQSYYGNKYSSLWPDEQKMVGMKRSYHFLVDNVPIPSFNCKFASSYVSPITRFDESTSCSNGGTTSLEPMVPNFRENPRSQGTIADQKSKKLIENNCDLTKDFLTLAPPRASPQSHSSSKEKGQTKDPSGVEWSNHQQLHSFFPAAKTNGNNNDEAVEHTIIYTATLE
nr:hypothetical protein [Tanacetum cinerariifolium]